MLDTIIKGPAGLPAFEREGPERAVHQNPAAERSGTGGWTRTSWKNYTARQQPDWPDLSKVETAEKQLALMPPLVRAQDVRALKQDLALAADGKAFILQGGDCSENFKENTKKKIDKTCKLLAGMALVIWASSGRPVIKTGRLAGQFAKPRSSDTETLDGKIYPSYRGDLVNDATPDLDARTPDPERLIKGYANARKTLEHLEAIRTSDVFSPLYPAHWLDAPGDFGALLRKYGSAAAGMAEALDGIRCSTGRNHAFLRHLAGIYTSHEALLLPYEAGLLRKDTAEGRWYGSSGHMLWIGERTRQIDSAHIEMMRGVSNPIGVKVGPEHSPKEISTLCRILNPRNEPGKLSLITRFGRKKIDRVLPPLIREIKGSGHRVVWISDPMHGNTFTSQSGYKTRRYEDIVSEIQRFFRIHAREKTVPGGIHLEMTGDHVTECLGGSSNTCDSDLGKQYLTSCDPRLNKTQSLEIAFQVARIMESHTGEIP